MQDRESEMSTDIEEQLVDAAWSYWECEGEIAKRYFATATDEDHAFYLRAQLWKELHPVDGFFNGLHRELKDLIDRFPEIDRTIDRHEYHFLLTQLTEEFNHYVMLADIFEHVMGRKITAEDTVQLAEEKKLGDVRREYVENGGALAKAAVGFTEGGGARLFREGAKLSGSTINDMTAHAMEIIYDDEKDHYAEQAKICVGLIETDDDLQRMTAAICAISDQRVKMRAEMFPGAMTDGEIEAFIAENARV
jgi:hypothetical protein